MLTRNLVSPNPEETAQLTTFRVRAKRWEHGWELHVEGVGVTQTPRLTEAEAVAREYIAMALDIDDAAFIVETEGEEIRCEEEGVGR